MLSRRIASIDAAEDLFELLDQSFDQHVLRVHRIHILKSFGHMVAGLHEALPYASEGELRAMYAKALKDAHDLYAEGGDKARAPGWRRLEKLVQLRVPGDR